MDGEKPMVIDATKQMEESSQDSSSAKVITDRGRQVPKSLNEIDILLTPVNLAPHVRVLRPSRTARMCERME